MGGMVAVWVGDAQRTSESAIFDMSLTKAIKSPVKFSSLHLRNCGQAKWSPARSNACGRQGVKRRGTYLLFKVGPVLFAERFIQHALCAVDTGHQSCQKRSHGGHTCPPPLPTRPCVLWACVRRGQGVVGANSRCPRLRSLPVLRSTSTWTFSIRSVQDWYLHGGGGNQENETPPDPSPRLPSPP